MEYYEISFVQEEQMWYRTIKKKIYTKEITAAEQFFSTEFRAIYRLYETNK